MVALTRADLALSSELRDLTSFATAFHGRLDHQGRLRYVDAGHGLTLHIHADGGWDRLSATGLPLGTGFGDAWESRTLTFAPGDMLVSCSDGVLDFYDGTLSAIDHLALISSGAESPDAVVRAVMDLAADAEATDDVTVLVIRRT